MKEKDRNLIKEKFIVSDCIDIMEFVSCTEISR